MWTTDAFRGKRTDECWPGGRKIQSTGQQTLTTLKTDLSPDSQQVFAPNQGSRENVKKVLIVITDGESQDAFKLPNAISEANAKKIVRFAIGVRGIFSTLHLNQICF